MQLQTRQNYALLFNCFSLPPPLSTLRLTSSQITSLIFLFISCWVLIVYLSSRFQFFIALQSHNLKLDIYLCFSTNVYIPRASCVNKLFKSIWVNTLPFSCPIRLRSLLTSQISAISVNYLLFIFYYSTRKINNRLYCYYFDITNIICLVFHRLVALCVALFTFP